jgi:hypothetical protein
MATRASRAGLIHSDSFDDQNNVCVHHQPYSVLAPCFSAELINPAPMTERPSMKKPVPTTKLLIDGARERVICNIVIQDR